MFQRPHHIISEFASRGWPAFFCTTTGSNVKVADNLFVEWKFADLDFNTPTLLYITMPTQWKFVDRFKDCVVWYDYIDVLELFKALGIVEAHKKMLDVADIVTCTAIDLLEEVLPIREDAVYLPNAASSEIFGISEVPIGGKRPIIGYIGAVAEWVDWKMVARLADMKPDWEFVVVGPDYEVQSVARCIEGKENVVRRRHVPWKVAVGMMKNMDVAIIPFNLNKITHACNPIKMWEYLACDKPVIVTPTRECLYNRRYLRIASTVWEFADAIEAAINEGSIPGQVEWVKSGNLWSHRVDAVIELVSAL